MWRLFLTGLLVLNATGAFAATFISFSSATYSVTESSSNAAISVLRSGNPHATVSVTYSTSNGTATAGSDYSAATGTLTFRPGQRLKTFLVPITNDPLIESNETLTVTLSNLTGNGSLRNPKSAVLTILDNDGNISPNLAITDVTIAEGNVGTTPITFQVFLTPPATNTVTVDFATADGSALAGSDYVATNGALTFLPGELLKTITVSASANTVNEPDKVFFVNLTNPINATAAPAQGIGIILNDDGPIVVDDQFATLENIPLIVPAPGVMSNDTDVAGNPFTASLVTDVANGTLTFNADGSFTYAPNTDFYGTDGFTYQTYDGVADSAVATVTLTVTRVNRPPVANGDVYSTPTNTPLNVTAPGVLVNDTDREHDPLTASIVSLPANGTLTFAGDGSFLYTPVNGFTGLDSFTYRANDGQTDSPPATVTLVVDASNRVPVAVADAYLTPAGIPLNVTVSGVLSNDSDPDGDPLTAVLVSNPVHGSLTLSGNGSFSYNPVVGFNGYDTFSYRAYDGIVSSSVAVVTLGVGDINVAPVASNDTFTVAQDEILSGNILANDTDADADPLTANLVIAPAHGTLNLNADGSFTYTPDGDFSGTETFTYWASDGTFGSPIATVTIEVTPAGGANDYDLYAKNASFAVNWASPNADSFRIAGKINPRGANVDLSGATMQLSLNGLPISAPVTLNNLGIGAVVSGATKIVARFSSATGAYSFGITGADLRSASGLTNSTGAGMTVLNVELSIAGANLAIPELNARLETPFTTAAGKSSKGKFSFKSHRLLTGAFNWNKTTAIQLQDGTFAVAGKGVIEARDGLSLLPTGPIGVFFVGNGAGQVTGSLLPAKRTFAVRVTGLPTTSLPAAGIGAATVYLLPIVMVVPTADGTHRFDTIIELKRATPLTTKWAR
ncbi:MAG: Ig-like domain-containing protein [Verrucomicrobiota bacterium]